MADYYDIQSKCIKELSTTLEALDSAEIQNLINAILQSEKVFTVGVGRVELSMLSFCKRLNHLNIKAYPVGSINEPSFTPNDLLIVGSRSGKTIIPLGIAKKAVELGGKLAYIGSSTQGFLAENADYRINIPSFGLNTKDGKFKSNQIMASLFEQTLLILGDVICRLIFDAKKMDIDKVNGSHANLE